MASISIITKVLFCVFLFELGLSTAFCLSEANAEQNIVGKDSLPGHSEQEEETRRGIHKLKGKVLGFEADHYVIKRSDGKEVSLRIDETTKMTKTFAPGERIEAKVIQYSDGHYALSIDLAP